MNAVRLRHQHRPLDAVLELADVSRPLVRLQEIQRRGGNRRHLPAVLDAHLGKEMLRKQQYVVGALREIRQRDRKYRKPVIEVLAEQFLLHQFLEIAACGGDESHVALEFLVGPDAAEGPLLQKTKQLHLHRNREIPDFIKEERAAVRRFSPSDAALAGVGERALLVPEQFRLHQRLRKRRAVEYHERLVPAPGKRLDRLGDQLLAGSARAAYQYRRFTRSDMTDLLIDDLHARRIADDTPGIFDDDVPKARIFRLERSLLLALLPEDAGRFSAEIGDDLQERDIAHQRPCIAGHLAVDRQRADNLSAVNERHTDERQRRIHLSHVRAIKESRVLAHIKDDLRLALLGHKSGYSLSDVIAAEHPFLGVKLTGGGFDAQFIAFKERERSAQHPHRLLEDDDNLLQKLADIAFPGDRRGDFLQNRYFR